MPRPQRDGMSPAKRMVRVLRYLADHDGSADSTEIRSGVSAYKRDDGGRKLWQRDLAELRRRGLVIPKHPGEEMSSRVELLWVMKPTRLFLTRAEHMVLAEVEDRLRQDDSAPSPLPEESAPGLRDLARLTRYLEERPGRKLTYAQVEQALGLGSEQLTALLREIVEADEEISDFTGRHPALDWIDYLPPDEEDPEGYVCALDAAKELGTEMAQTFDPRERTGQLGFFAYSAAETDHRLALIDHALAELDLSEHQRRCLGSARRKLSEWRMRLPPA